MEWKLISTAPAWDGELHGQRLVSLRDQGGREATGKRTLFNNSGWIEAGTNQELWPVEWKPLGGSAQ